MAMYDMKFKDFYQVKNHYENVKRIRGRKEDVRPIADRARAWERIVRVSDTCYSLTLPSYVSDEPLEIITWGLVSGKEVVCIYNGVGEWGHQHVYSFLDRFLPQGVYFLNKGGKHFIRAQNGEDRFLPKCKSIYKIGEGHIADGERPSVILTRDDPSHGWKFTGEEHLPPRPRIDKDKKKPYKKAINDLCEWVWTMLPLLENNTSIGWSERATLQKKIGVDTRIYNATESPELFLRILSDTNSELRVEMACEFIRHAKENTNGTFNHETRQWTHPKLSDDAKVYRSKFTRWINKNGGFNTTTTKY